MQDLDKEWRPLIAERPMWCREFLHLDTSVGLSEPVSTNRV